MESINERANVKGSILMGLEINIMSIVNLSEKLRDHSYAYDKDGKVEFEEDIKTLADQISLLKNRFLDLKSEL